jgi:hypothetical protein
MRDDAGADLPMQAPAGRIMMPALRQFPLPALAGPVGDAW